MIRRYSQYWLAFFFILALKYTFQSHIKKFGYDDVIFTGDDVTGNKNEPKISERTFNTASDIFLDYTEYSTIQGLIYIFFSYQTTLGKSFWSIILILMFMLGCYWCTEAYQNWSDHPVLTTIKTAGFPLEQVSTLTHRLSINNINLPLQTSIYIRRAKTEWL